jgi:hypothetical protein
MDGGEPVKWVWRLFDTEAGLKEAVPVQLIPEHLSAETYWGSQWCPNDVLYDIRLVVKREPGPQLSDVVWVMLCQPWPTSGHGAVALAWRTGVDSVEPPPSVRQELERIGLDKLIPHIMRLGAYVNAYH